MRTLLYTSLDSLDWITPTGDTDDLNFEFFNTDGRPDSGLIVPQNDPFVFGDYEYTLDDAPAYDGFQLKIVLKNYNQPYIEELEKEKRRSIIVEM